MKHVAHMEEDRNVYVFWWGMVRETDNLKDLSTDGSIILK